MSPRNDPSLAVNEPTELTATCPDCGKPIRADADVRAGAVWVGELDPASFRVHALNGCDLIRLSRALSAVAQAASRVQVAAT